MAAPDLVPTLQPLVQGGLSIAVFLVLSAIGGFMATRFVPGKNRDLRRLVYGLVSLAIFSGSTMLLFATSSK